MAASLGSRPALGIATAAITQLAAATPSFASANESVYPQLADDVLSEPLTLVDSPTVPGAARSRRASSTIAPST